MPWKNQKQKGNLVAGRRRFFGINSDRSSREAMAGEPALMYRLTDVRRRTGHRANRVPASRMPDKMTPTRKPKTAPFSRTN